MTEIQSSLDLFWRILDDTQLRPDRTVGCRREFSKRRGGMVG